MKASDILKFAEKKSDPDKATLEECTRIAKRLRNYAWDGGPPENKSHSFKSTLLALMPG